MINKYIIELCLSRKSNVISVMSDIVIDYHILLGISIVRKIKCLTKYFAYEFLAYADSRSKAHA